MNGKRWELLIKSKVAELAEAIGNKDVKTICLKGLYSSAKAFAISQTV